MTKFEELVAKLSELFELDKTDLDFGIHRIIKTKYDQITKYLNERLPERVTSVLSELVQAEVGDSLADLKRQVIDGLGDAAFNEDGSLDSIYAKTPLGKRYLVAVEASQDTRSGAQTEAEVYSHLYEFFSRYYEEGDFISRRRRTAGRETYSVPYDGEEVVLHWANKDQYYIKSTEYLKDYTFTIPLNPSDQTGRVQFRLTRMDALQNNNKANRIFVLDDEEGIKAKGNTLVIPFHFAEGKKRNKTEEAEWEQAVLDALPEEWQQRLVARDMTYTGDGERSILQKHLRNYTKKNTSDYFIHKDLGGFLRRELDFYIKNEVMYLDDVDSRPADYLEKELRKIKAIRTVAHDLIDFLAQFEDFQKRLWLKKTFVIDTNWCITLDRVPEELYPEIAANDAQREEWVRLFAINEIEQDTVTVGYCEPLTVEFLTDNGNLVLDTAFFSVAFKAVLLATIGDIDAQTDGVLVHAENFQGLSLLQAWARRTVKSVSIDPPYNTGSDEFCYKDGYQHSAWYSMVLNSVLLTKELMTDTGLIACTINDKEVGGLMGLLQNVFGEQSLVACCPWRSEASGGKEKTGLRTGHEYVAIFHNGSRSEISADERSTGELNLTDKWGKYRKGRELRKWGGTSLRSDRPGQFYPLPTPSGEIALPIRNDGKEGHWRWGQNNANIKIALEDSEFFHWEKTPYDQGVAVDGETERWTPYEKIRDEKKAVGWATWLDSHGTNADGTRSLKNLFGFKPFETPKPPRLIGWFLNLISDDDCWCLDSFAGSGTVGHAVVEANRETGGSRRYILMDMGDSFDTVLKPRMQKIVNSVEWKDGKPTSRNTGISHCFKYLRLESYEDALNNLTLDDRSADLLGLPEDVQDDYLLRYSLDIETRASLLDLERFENPFDYKLKVYTRETGEAEPHPVDLPETFNYLLGLRVRTMQMRDGFLVIEGENPAAETVLVIWRNVHEKDNATLEAFVTDTLRINPADTEYAAIYINGDTTLDDPHKKILLTEQAFHGLMFDVKEL